MSSAHVAKRAFAIASIALGIATIGCRHACELVPPVAEGHARIDIRTESPGLEYWVDGRRAGRDVAEVVRVVRTLRPGTRVTVFSDDKLLLGCDLVRGLEEAGVVVGAFWMQTSTWPGWGNAATEVREWCEAEAAR